MLRMPREVWREEGNESRSIILEEWRGAEEGKLDNVGWIKGKDDERRMGRKRRRRRTGDKRVERCGGARTRSREGNSKVWKHEH